MCITSNSNTVFPCKIYNTNIKDTEIVNGSKLCEL